LYIQTLIFVAEEAANLSPPEVVWRAGRERIVEVAVSMVLAVR
jgi:hypothetical protein